MQGIMVKAGLASEDMKMALTEIRTGSMATAMSQERSTEAWRMMADIEATITKSGALVDDHWTREAERSDTEPQRPPAADQNIMNTGVSEAGTTPETGVATASGKHRMERIESNATESQRAPAADLIYLGAARWTLRGQYLAMHRWEQQSA
jgi:hypothetical protein